MPKIKNILERKQKILDVSDERFINEIKKTEKSLFAAILSVLERYTTGGKLKSSQSDLKLLNDITKKVEKAIRDSSYANKINAYLPNFDQIETLNKQLFSTILNKDIKKLPISAQKKIVIEEVTDALLSPSSIKSNVANPIRKILYRHVTFGSDISSAQNELRTFVKGDKNNGYLSRYINTVARDAVNQYDGAINQQIQNQFELDGFMYVGSLIKTSRDFCIGMIGQSALFSHLAVEPQKYRMSDLPEIISIGEGMSGWIAGTNESNFFQNRGGWGCRHQAIPVVLDEEYDI